MCQKRLNVLAAAALGVGTVSFIVTPPATFGQNAEQSSAQKQPAASDNPQSPDQMVMQWPATCQKAYKETVGKYGQPDGVTPTRMVWTEKGPSKEFKEIILLNEEFAHDFPVSHKDCLEHVVAFKVPQEKGGDLAKFDGSVIVDRTRGTLGARCDSEAHNLIALNLAYDIVSGKKSVDEARKAYGDAVTQEKNGKLPEIGQKLAFQPMSNAGDTDVATIGPEAVQAQPASAKQEPAQPKEK